jgi:YD repeat-containing protein
MIYRNTENCKILPENVTYAYDSVVSPNKGKGHLTSISDQSGSTTYTYNALGQIITDKRVIATKTYTTSYLYNAAGLISQITYPSGRIVIYARNVNGQVTRVTVVTVTPHLIVWLRWVTVTPHLIVCR